MSPSEGVSNLQKQDIEFGMARRLSAWIDQEKRLPSIQSVSPEERWAARAVLITHYSPKLLLQLSPHAQQMIFNSPNADEAEVDLNPYDTFNIQSRYQGEDSGILLWSKSKQAFVNFNTNYLRSEAERRPFQIFIKNGLVYDVDGNLYDTSDAKLGGLGAAQGSALIVMDKGGNLFSSKFQEVGVFHHSSFLAGQPVAFAGEIRVLNGQIVQLSNTSGHYMPSNGSFTQILQRFAKSGLMIDNIRLSGNPFSLHTEALEHYFGPVKVVVLNQTETYRTVNIALKSTSQPTVLTRAFSMVNRTMDPALGAIHQEIVKGGSMGKTFRAHGYSVVKNQIERDRVKITPELQKAFATDQDFAELNIYEFYAQKDNGPLLLYSTVAELDSPRTVTALRELESTPQQLQGSAHPSVAYDDFKKWVFAHFE